MNFINNLKDILSLISIAIDVAKKILDLIKTLKEKKLINNIRMGNLAFT